MAISRPAAFLILLLAFAFGCARPIEPAAGMKYFEIVQEKGDCPDGGCFTEYLFTSSGIALKKQYDTPNYRDAPAMELRLLNGSAAQSILGSAERFAYANKNASDEADARNHVYFSDNEGTYALSFRDDQQGKFLEIFEDAKAGFDAATTSEDFYVHQYYQPLAGDTLDFHIFSNGAFIRSVFASDSDTLKGSSMHIVQEDDLFALKNMASNVTKPQYAEPAGCRVGTGLVYGYVEIKKNGKYVDAYTCGDGNGKIDAIFTFLKNKYG